MYFPFLFWHWTTQIGTPDVCWMFSRTKWSNTAIHVLGTWGNPPPELTWPTKHSASLFQNSISRLHWDHKPVSEGWRQLGCMSCFTSAGRVTLGSGTTFLYINALACLSGTTLGVASVNYCLDLGFNAEICIEEVKINSAKPTVIKQLTKTQRKRDICTFDYSVRVMNNHAG